MHLKVDQPTFPVGVKLDKSQYGKMPQPDGDKAWLIFQADKDKKTGAVKENLITFVVGEPVLVAVTDDQYKNWKGWKLVARPAVITRMY